MERAVGLTGYEYLPKLPLPDGTIYACGGGYHDLWRERQEAPTAKTPEEIRQEEIRKIDREIAEIDSAIIDGEKDIERSEQSIRISRRRIDELQIRKSNLEKQKRALVKRALVSAPTVVVPEGSMEWLLHEVGHWLAATPQERLLPNYGILADPSYDDKTQVNPNGFGYDREWQAWAFEEIVLAPFGPARGFISPSCAGGVGFSKAQIPESAFTHIDKQLKGHRVDLEPFRQIFGEWIDWGNHQADRAPWKM
jgi:hypothetical protein